MLFTVLNASVKKELPDNGYGPKKVVALELRDSAEVLHNAEWFTNASTPLPAAGTQLDGELEDGQYGKKFKPSQVRGGGGGFRGGRGTSPQEQASIRASVALDKAHIGIEQAATLGLVKFENEEALARAVLRRADFYYRWMEKTVKEAA